MKPIIRKETVILTVKPVLDNLTNTIQSFRFKDNENLRNVKLWGVQAYYNTIVPFNLTGTKFETVNKKVFVKTFLTLYDISNIDFLNKAPLPIFQTIENGMVELRQTGQNPEWINSVESTICEKDFKFFAGQKLDLQNSFVELIPDIGDDTFFKSQNYIFDFYYSRIDLDKI